MCRLINIIDTLFLLKYNIGSLPYWQIDNLKIMFLELEKDNLAEVIASNEVVLVQFSASWCGNCRIMKPKFKKMASENENVPFLVVDAEQFTESRKLANVDNLPTFAALKNGVWVNQTQTNKAEVLAELVASVV